MDGELRQTVGEMYFDADGERFHAGQCAASQNGKARGVPEGYG
jgi:hypothetical protein